MHTMPNPVWGSWHAGTDSAITHTSSSSVISLERDMCAKYAKDEETDALFPEIAHARYE